jgi:hypothetical protein
MGVHDVSNMSNMNGTMANGSYQDKIKNSHLYSYLVKQPNSKVKLERLNTDMLTTSKQQNGNNQLDTPLPSTQRETYPNSNRVDCSQSVQSFYDNRPSTSESTYDDQDAIVGIFKYVPDFRAKVKTDFIKLDAKIDHTSGLNRKKLFKALNYPTDTKTSEIIKDLKTKTLKNKSHAIRT